MSRAAFESKSAKLPLNRTHPSRPLNRIHPSRPLNRIILPCQDGYYNSNIKVLSIVAKVAKKLRYYQYVLLLILVNNSNYFFMFPKNPKIQNFQFFPNPYFFHIIFPTFFPPKIILLLLLQYYLNTIKIPVITARCGAHHAQMECATCGRPGLSIACCGSNNIVPQNGN